MQPNEEQPQSATTAFRLTLKPARVSFSLCSRILNTSTFPALVLFVHRIVLLGVSAAQERSLTVGWNGYV